MFILNSLKKVLHRCGLIKSHRLAVGSVRFGDLYRTEPLSKRYGFDRGGSVDRIYIEYFLEKNKQVVRGRVLEVADNQYTKEFGGGRVTQSDILHVNESHPKATIIANLEHTIEIGENLFDCIILTQTLQFIYDYRKGIENCYRLLKPGGYLLMTVPGITNVGKDAFNWYWSFTSHSVQKMLSEFFSPTELTVETYGNVLTAAAFLYGFGKSEIKEKEYTAHDPSYQVIIAAAARKS